MMWAKMWELGVVTAIEVSLSPGPQWSETVDIYIYLSIYLSYLPIYVLKVMSSDRYLQF